MRLYLNDKEVKFVKMGLQRIKAQDTYLDRVEINRIDNILNRIDICEVLQNNERRSKEDADK